MNIFLYILGGLIVGFVLVQWVRIRFYARISRQLIKETQKQEHYPDTPDRRILIIGDSLWEGVGADGPSDSMAGRLIADLPNALVMNQAESGARIADGMAQLETATDTYEEFDQIIIQLGANDIVHLTDIQEAKRDLEQLLEQAQSAGEHVAYAVSGSVGFAPVFLQPLDWFYSWVSRRYIGVFKKLAKDAGIAYIDLYRSGSKDPFNKDPDKYYAADLFHLSAAGYKLWYRKCQNKLQCFELDKRYVGKQEVAVPFSFKQGFTNTTSHIER